MIVKQRDNSASDSGDIRAQAGRQAEEQMAFYLRRAFGEKKDVFVFNDLRLIRTVEGVEDAAQIDHLILHRAGLIIVESKSVHGQVRVNERGEWSRTFGGRHQGMPSPIEQAKRQAKHLIKFLDDHAPEIAGKLLGLIQCHFGALSIDVVVAISDSGIIDRPRKLPLPEVHKADQVAAQVTKLLEQQRREAGIFAPSSLTANRGRNLSRSEVENLIAFLPARHRPFNGTADKSAKRVSAPPLQPVELSPLPRVLPGLTPARDAEAAAREEDCAVCGKPLTPKSAQYCRDNEKRFKGRLLCYEHQRVGRTTRESSAEAAHAAG